MAQTVSTRTEEVELPEDELPLNVGGRDFRSDISDHASQIARERVAAYLRKLAKVKEDAAVAQTKKRMEAAMKGLSKDNILWCEVRERRRPKEIYIPTRKAAVVESVGTGVPLGHIDYVNKAISKKNNGDLRTLHSLCYGTPGVTSMRKKDLRKFAGYPFDEDSHLFRRRKGLAMKLEYAERAKTLAQAITKDHGDAEGVAESCGSRGATETKVAAIRQILGVEACHSREETVEKMLRFLLKPQEVVKEEHLPSEVS